jgi:hypothetical protein
MRKAAYRGAVLLIVVIACSSRETTIAPTPTAPVQSPANGIIAVGESLAGTFIGNPLMYVLTAPSDGRLTVRLTWNPDQDGARLKLTFGDTSFMAVPPNWSPLVGVAPVSSGKAYRITIEEGHAPWDYAFNDSFTLTTSIEPGGPFDYRVSN